MDAEQLNKLVVKIETAYRNDNENWKGRLGILSSDDVRAIMQKHKFGLQCKKCLNKKGGRYCCKRHSTYYRKVIMEFYGMQSPHPFRNNDVCGICGKSGGDIYSPDHIKPISRGGLEFDKHNLQYTHLRCNLSKNNHTKEEQEQKDQTKKELLKHILPALALNQIVRESEERKQKRLSSSSSTSGLTPRYPELLYNSHLPCPEGQTLDTKGQGKA